MRVAVWTPAIRVCGPSAWVDNLMPGLRGLGVEAVTLASTVSGRASSLWGADARHDGSWWRTAPDVVVKDADLVRALNEYDAVILPEPRQPTLDRRAARGGTVPAWVDVLERLDVPWTTALHGPQYSPREAPFLERVLKRLPTQRVVCHSTAAVESNPDAFREVGVVPTPLPYVPLRDPAAPFPQWRTVGIIGRAEYSKGHPVVAFAATELDAETCERVELWGSTGHGLSVSPPAEVFEDLRDLYGYTGVYNAPRIHKPVPWKLERAGRTPIYYCGGYRSGVEVADRLGVCVNFTGASYSRGLTEFSTLEAADAGSVLIVPRHVNTTPLSVIEVEGFTSPVGRKKIKNEQGTVRMMVDAVQRALRGVDADTREASVRWNREALRRVHDPRVTARALLDAAGVR